MSGESELPFRLRNALYGREFNDSEISKMSDREMVRQYAGWHLGDPTWGDDFFDLIESLQARACNSHYDLLEALELWIKYDSSEDSNGTEMMLNYADALEATKAAIARAKGGQS